MKNTAGCRLDLSAELNSCFHLGVEAAAADPFRCRAFAMVELKAFQEVCLPWHPRKELGSPDSQLCIPPSLLSTQGHYTPFGPLLRLLRGSMRILN